MPIEPRTWDELLSEQPADPFFPQEQNRSDRIHERKSTQPIIDLDGICVKASTWEKWLRVELQRSLGMAPKFSLDQVDRLVRLPLPDRTSLSTEQCAVIDIITHLGAIRRAVGTFSKVAEEKLGTDRARTIKDEVARLASRLVFCSISLTTAAAEAAFDQMIKARENTLAANRKVAGNTRKLTPKLEAIAVTRMNELQKGDQPMTSVAKEVAAELKRDHKYPGDWRPIYDAYQRSHLPASAFPLLQGYPSQRSTCQLFSSSPIESALNAVNHQIPKSTSPRKRQCKKVRRRRKT
jgi:hypothetical protein